MSTIAGRVAQPWLGLLAVLGALATSGCQTIGPSAIGVGRAHYNNVIQATAKQQVLANIVRVHNREPTLFMEVNGVDASVTTTATASVGLSSLGAKTGALGSVTPGGTYSEVPIIHYSTLTGQALVQQITSPITPDSLSYLYDSDWRPAAVFQLTIDRLTPDDGDYAAALNAILQLDYYGVLVASAFPSGSQSLALRPPSSSPIPTLPNDALILSLQPGRPLPADDTGRAKERKDVGHLWIRLLRIYGDSDPSGAQFLANGVCKGQVADACLAALDLTLQSATPAGVDQLLHQLPRGLELRTRPSFRLASGADLPVSVPASGIAGERPGANLAGVTVDAPNLRTRSALGVLKSAAEYESGVRFVTAAEFAAIRAARWNTGACVLFRGYYLAPGARPMAIDSRIQALDGSGAEPECSLFTAVAGRPFDFATRRDSEMEEQLIDRRVFILIIQGDPPPDAYVAYSDGKASYYIASDDQISKANFTLVNQILSMQAIAAPTVSSTPVIAIGP